MFKSVFAKYITTFTVLLLCSFMLLLWIIGSIFHNFNEQAEQDNMRGVAVSCAEHLTELYTAHGEGDFVPFVLAGTQAAADPFLNVF